MGGRAFVVDGTCRRNIFDPPFLLDQNAVVACFGLPPLRCCLVAGELGFVFWDFGCPEGDVAEIKSGLGEATVLFWYIEVDSGLGVEDGAGPGITDHALVISTWFELFFWKRRHSTARAQHDAAVRHQIWADFFEKKYRASKEAKQLNSKEAKKQRRSIAVELIYD